MCMCLIKDNIKQRQTIKENKMSLSNLFQDIEEVSEELKSEELENNSGSAFVKSNGVYKSTIERAFITETKKGGVQFDLHLSGDNVFNVKLYPVTVKDGKKVTTFKTKGKTQSLQDYKMLKQLIFVATGKGQELPDIKLKEEEVTFKEYGKEKTLEVATLVDLIGKELQYGVRCEEEYNYEDGEVDKTQIKTDNEGNPRYKMSLFSVYSAEGKAPAEIIKDADAEQLEKDKSFLLGDKGIKKVKLELPEVEEDEEETEEDVEF